jgi:hypothetical protein
MSADNGCYIGRFTTEKGFEYRVIHAQAIENCDYSSFVDDSYPTKLIHAYRIVYYGRSEIYDVEGAWKKARELYEEILNSAFPICEYGVSEIYYDEPFPNMTTKEASDYIDEYWKKRQRSRYQ